MQVTLYKADLVRSESSREKLFEFNMGSDYAEHFAERFIKRIGNVGYKLPRNVKLEIYKLDTMPALVAYINAYFKENDYPIYVRCAKRLYMGKWEVLE